MAVNFCNFLSVTGGKHHGAMPPHYVLIIFGKGAKDALPPYNRPNRRCRF